jgi:hypothetical protein
MVGPAEPLLTKTPPNEPAAAIAFCKTNPIRAAGRGSEPESMVGPAEPLRNEQPNEPNAAIAFCKTNPIRAAGRESESEPMAGSAEPLRSKAPNEPDAAIAFCKTNPIRAAGRETESELMVGPAEPLQSKAPNEPNGMPKKVGECWLARAARQRLPGYASFRNRVFVGANCRPRHCGTAGSVGGVDSRASFGTDRPYFIGDGVNRVPETVR